MVEATIDGQRILLSNTAFSQREAIKRISGSRAKYIKRRGQKDEFAGWHVPLTVDTCHTIRRTFGSNLIIGNDLANWFIAEVNRLSTVEEIRTGEGVTLDRVQELAPKMWMAMQARDYQNVGASFLVHGGQVMLGDDPGLGKTIQTLAALIEKGAQRILVCCPKTTARPVWCLETNAWAPLIMPFVAQGTHSQREQVIEAFNTMPYDGPKMLIINTEMIRAKKHWRCPDGTEWDIEPKTFKRRLPIGCHQDHDHVKFAKYTWPQLFKQKWDAIVMDESHQFLASMYNVQSKNITQGRLGAMHLRRLLVPMGMASALSGTPFRSDLRKAWGTLNWLRPDVFTSFHRWAQAEFDYEEDDGKGWGQPDYKREPRDPEGFNARLRPYMLAREKATVASDLPPVQFMGTRPLDNQKDGLIATWLELTPEQQKAYAKMEELAEADVEGGRLMANGVLAEITRKRQLASAYGRMVGREFVPTLPSNKIEWTLEFLQEHEGHDTKVVIASEFTQMCGLVEDTVRSELGMDTLAITGKVTGKARDLAVQRFQDPDDPCKVMVLNMSAGGVGITLDAADYMILLDVPWVSDKEKQVVDRIHRVSRVHNVFVYRLLSLGTIDEWMASLTDEQRRILMSASPAAIELAREGLAA